MTGIVIIDCYRSTWLELGFRYLSASIRFHQVQKVDQVDLQCEKKNVSAVMEDGRIPSLADFFRVVPAVLERAQLVAQRRSPSSRARVSACGFDPMRSGDRIANGRRVRVSWTGH